MAMQFTLALISLLTVALAGCVSLPITSAPQAQQCYSSKPENTPTSRFRIDETAGTVFDSLTNLTWKRCAEGQTYRSGQCEGEAGNWKWDEAMARFRVDSPDWRLPNIDELYSIVEEHCKSPAINQRVFVNTPSVWFWSGSPVAGSSNYAWGVYFYDGYAGSDGRSSGSSVRLVRGGQWFYPSGILQKERSESQARLAREAEAAKQNELKQRQDEEERRRKEGELETQIAESLQAEKDAVVYCPDKAACDKASSLTQIYLNQTADMKIQVATDTIVETYNPTEDGKLGLKAIRIPGKGTSAAITLTATCKDEKGRYDEVCRLRKIQAYRGFRPFVERMLKN